VTGTGSSEAAGIPISARDRHVTASSNQTFSTKVDLPDKIELRRRFFADSGRRRMVAASVLDQDWLPRAGSR
jgi:hypothetical protein